MLNLLVSYSTKVLGGKHGNESTPVKVYRRSCRSATIGFKLGRSAGQKHGGFEFFEVTSPQPELRSPHSLCRESNVLRLSESIRVYLGAS